MNALGRLSFLVSFEKYIIFQLIRKVALYKLYPINGSTRFWLAKNKQQLNLIASQYCKVYNNNNIYRLIFIWNTVCWKLWTLEAAVQFIILLLQVATDQKDDLGKFCTIQYVKKSTLFIYLSSFIESLLPKIRHFAARKKYSSQTKNEYIRKSN